jgi:hypothetical protein
MRHLLDGIINIASNDGSCPSFHGVDGYLHLNLTIILAMGLKWMAAVHGDWPIVAKSNECTQQHSWKTQAVLARVPQTTVHIHLLKQTTKALQTHCNQLRKKNGKSGTKASNNKKKQIRDYSVGTLPLSWNQKRENPSQLSIRYSYSPIPLTVWMLPKFEHQLHCWNLFWTEQQMDRN